MLTRFGFKFGFRRVIGEGPSYMELFKDLLKNLLDKNTYKGYRLFIGRGIYHIASSSTKSCLELLKLQKDLRLVKVKSFS